MTAASIKQQLYPGSCWDLTNHYITRPDHPCYGTRRVVVSESNGSAFYTVRHPQLVGHHENSSRIPWPKASQIQRDANGTIRLYGGGCSQAANELFLTLKPADVAHPYCVKCDECRNVVRWCETVEESARGGYCDDCNAMLDARYPERAANRARLQESVPAMREP